MADPGLELTQPDFFPSEINSFLPKINRAEKRLRICETSWLALAPTAWAPYQTSKKWRRF